MGQVFEALSISLPLALGIAAAPWAIIFLMILLLTPRAVSNAYAFLMAWYIGLMLVGIVVLISPGLINDSGEPSRLMGWIRLGMGVVFLTFSLFLFKKIPKGKEQQTIPKWIERVDAFGFFQASMIGFFMSTLNLKNSSMAVVGAASIGRQGLNFSQELIALLLFCLVASIGVLIPHTIFLLSRKNAELIFGKIKVWILKNRVLVLLGILLVFGGMSLYKGITIIGNSNLP
jgi:hypothetical protein